VPKWVVGESPPRRLGESPPLSTLPVFEVCVGTSDGEGPPLGDVPILPASSLKVPMVVFPLGTDRDESVPRSSSGLASNPKLLSALPLTSDVGVKPLAVTLVLDSGALVSYPKISLALPLNLTLV
jgi:hypothetical protein